MLLGLLLIRLISNELSCSWDQIRDEMEDFKLVHLENSDGSLVLCTETTSMQRQYMKSLKIIRAI